VENPAELALILVGLGVGTFGALVGVGGGFVLVPILLLLYPEMPANELTSISLAVVLVNSLSGTAAYARQRRTDYRSALLLGISSLPGAVAGALVVGKLPREAFDASFAAVLGGAGTFVLTRSTRRSIVQPVTGRWVVRRVMEDSLRQRFVYAYGLWTAIVISIVVGFASSLLGIGGGIVRVPLMIWALHFPVHIATATSQVILAMTAAEGISVHVAQGTLSGGSTLTRVVLLAAGTVPGAQLGAFVARRLRGPVITRILGVSMILVGARLALKAIQLF